MYVKVDGKQLTLEPRGDLSLPPGSHTVYFRKDEADPWEPAVKKLKLEPGKKYKVRMQTPNTLEIQKL